MKTVKSAEILAGSQVGWADAAKIAIAKTQSIEEEAQSVHIKEKSFRMKNGKVTEYFVRAKVF